MDLVVQSPDELLAAVPHVLGFKPEESIVLVPFRPGLPITRVDLPRTAADREEVWDALSGPYGRHARPGARLAIICITEDRRSAELASQHLSNRLQDVGVTTHIRLWSDGERWREFNTGQTGLQTPSTAERIAAATVLTGAAQPAASRESLAASMVGDREPIAQLLPAARAAAAPAHPLRSGTGHWTGSSSSTPAASGSPTSTVRGCSWPWRRSAPGTRSGRT